MRHTDKFLGSSSETPSTGVNSENPENTETLENNETAMAPPHMA